MDYRWERARGVVVVVEERVAVDEKVSVVWTVNCLSAVVQTCSVDS
jgi:hypothetical protein